MEVLARVTCGNLSLVVSGGFYVSSGHLSVAVAALLVYLGCDVKHG